MTLTASNLINSTTLLAPVATLAMGLSFISPIAAHDGALPLGDGKVSSGPKRGNVYSCQTRFNPNAPGAQATGDWISGNKWYPERKPTVDGNIRWRNAKLSATKRGNTRKISANNLPSHATGKFPVQRSDDAYQYDRNPNRISTQKIALSLPANPKIASRASCVPMGMIGISLTGAAIFNSLDARGEDAPAHEIQDRCGGHPEQRGQYHYHNYSPCMSDKAGPRGKHSDLVGYALDGFGIYGLYGNGGKKLANADLDSCHGHTGKVKWNGKSREIYHYHMTSEYPYTIGCFRGKPISTGLKSAGRRGPERGLAGRDRLAIAANELGVSLNKLRRAVGAPPPDFRRASRILKMPASRIRAAMRIARN